MEEHKDRNWTNPLAQFIVNAPLYVPTVVPIGLYLDPEAMRSMVAGSSGLARIMVNPRIQFPVAVWRECLGCNGGTTRWSGPNEEQGRVLAEGHVDMVFYTCGSCLAIFVLLMRWNHDDKERIVFEKLGEYPRRSMALPQDVKEMLGDYATWWTRSMELRELGYGMGALVYIRRIVEGMTDKLLEMLANAMENDDEPKEKSEAIRQVIRNEKNFTKKMELAANTIPATMLPHRQNPFATMFQILSGGMHDETDEQCCVVADALKESMILVIARLKSHIEKGSAYKEAVKNLQRYRTKQEGSG